MKKIWAGIITVVLLWSACSAPEQTTSTNSSSPTTKVTDSTLNSDFFQAQEVSKTQKLRFLPLLDSSYYKQKDSFATAFRTHYGVPKEHPLLSVQNTTLYGTTDTLFWVQFGNSHKAPTCAFPLQEQHFIFNQQGQLIYQNYVRSGQFLENAIDSMPIYLTIEHNCEGEGQHHAYILQAGQLVDILNVLFENMPLTFDVKEDSSVFQGTGALEPSLKDVNHDGHVDLLLKGKKLHLYSSHSNKRFSVQRPYKRSSVCYYFLYEPTKETFRFVPNFSPTPH